MYTGWRTWWPAPVREALPLCREFTYCVYCYLPGFGLWGIVDAQYIFWTLRRRLESSHMPVCAGLVVWGMLDGATRGRCLIVLWGRGALSVDWFGVRTRQLWWPWFACLAAAWEAFEFVHYILDGATRGRCLIVLWGRGALCQRTGFRYTAVVVAVGCMPGCGLGGIWMCTLYFWTFVSSMYGHWYWRAVVRGFRGLLSLGAWSTWRGPWAAGRPEWRVNAGCVDVYIRELDARGA